MKDKQSFTASIDMQSEAGDYGNGTFGARLTIKGLPSEDMAERVADYIYKLLSERAEEMLKTCAPEGEELLELIRVRGGDARVVN